MTRFARIGERPKASRTDDLGSPHIPVSPETWLLEAGVNLGAAARGPRTRGRPLAESRGDAVEHSHRLGARPYGRFWPVHVWPDLRCPPGRDAYGVPRQSSTLLSPM